jgi:Nuclear transport factor 2 (NTF2) domain
MFTEASCKPASCLEGILRKGSDSLFCVCHVTGVAACGHTTFLVMVNGSVKYEKNPIKVFSQTFILSAVSGTWKIVSDSYRTFD